MQNRQALGKMMAAATGASLLPQAAEAATVTALAFTCIDYRLVDDAVRFFNRRHMTNEYDQVSASVPIPKFVSTPYRASNEFRNRRTLATY
jgi:hypothetical protein